MFAQHYEEHGNQCDGGFNLDDLIEPDEEECTRKKHQSISMSTTATLPLCDDSLGSFNASLRSVGSGRRQQPPRPPGRTSKKEFEAMMHRSMPIRMGDTGFDDSFRSGLSDRSCPSIEYNDDGPRSRRPSTGGGVQEYNDTGPRSRRHDSFTENMHKSLPDFGDCTSDLLAASNRSSFDDSHSKIRESYNDDGPRSRRPSTGSSVQEYSDDGPRARRCGSFMENMHKSLPDLSDSTSDLFAVSHRSYVDDNQTKPHGSSASLDADALDLPVMKAERPRLRLPQGDRRRGPAGTHTVLQRARSDFTMPAPIPDSLYVGTRPEAKTVTSSFRHEGGASSSCSGPALRRAQSDRLPPTGRATVSRSHSDMNSGSGLGRLQNSLRSGQGVRALPPRPSPPTRSAPERSRSSGSTRKVADVKYLRNQRHQDPNGQDGRYTGVASNFTGAPCGDGRLDFANGGYYEGEWLHGIRTGSGKLLNRLNGDLYEGEFMDDYMHGLGNMLFADGRTFKGKFVLGKLTEGCMVYPNGASFTGNFRNGKRHCVRGTYAYQDGSVYVGNFEDDAVTGHGQMTWPNGSKHIGDWKNGKQDGFGKELGPDGVLRHEGLWHEGRIVA